MRCNDQKCEVEKKNSMFIYSKLEQHSSACEKEATSFLSMNQITIK